MEEVEESDRLPVVALMAVLALARLMEAVRSAVVLERMRSCSRR
jgi:hypothetical protein